MDLHPRFPLKDVNHWASRYAYEDDEPIIAIGLAVQMRGYYKKEEFLRLCTWKAPRIIRHCESNDSKFIEYTTRVALSPDNLFERLRIGVLTSLEGVNWPVASVLLHFGHKEPYPILDFRALWSLGVDRKPQWYTFEMWWKYVEYCRELRQKTGVTMRVLDRALWQYSKEHQ